MPALLQAAARARIHVCFTCLSRPPASGVSDDAWLEDARRMGALAEFEHQLAAEENVRVERVTAGATVHNSVHCTACIAQSQLLCTSSEYQPLKVYHMTIHIHTQVAPS